MLTITALPDWNSTVRSRVTVWPFSSHWARNVYLYVLPSSSAGGVTNSRTPPVCVVGRSSTHTWALAGTCTVIRAVPNDAAGRGVGKAWGLAAGGVYSGGSLAGGMKY